MKIIKKLNFLLTKKDKQYLIFLLLFSLFISVIETAGVSVIMPFISVASDFNLIDSNQYYQALYEWFNFEKKVNFVITFGFFLVLFYLVRGAVNFLYVYMLNRFAQSRYHLIVFRLFQNYLGFSYKDFVNKNSSYLTKTLVNEANNLSTLIQSVLFLISEAFVALFIYAMLLYVNWKITLILTAILFVNIIFLTQSISKKIKKQGVKRADYQKIFYEIISSTFGNFKFIKLLSNDKEIIKKFHNASSGFSQMNMNAKTLNHFPRLFLEAVGFSLIAMIITYLVWKYQQDIKSVIPILSMFVLALFRLMPSMNRILSSYNFILYNRKALDIIHNDLMFDIEELGNEQVSFAKQIELKSVSFSYGEKEIISNLTLSIKKGEKIAFIGESGSGKSTLVDIITGLYKPVSGNVTIDDMVLDESNVKAWRSKIGYIPQSVYLFDGTIAENVAFGRPYNKEQIINSLKKAHIFDYLMNDDGLETRVGEGGIMLSGGQKQRIAIARALYGNPEILVLDEATSALDDATEEKIMQEIYHITQGKTLIIIAHRLSTIQHCDSIYTLKDGSIISDSTNS